MENSTILEPNHPEESHCIKVSQRKAEYDAKMMTQKSLIDLGKKIEEQNKNSKSRKEKIAYLRSVARDMSDFNATIFMTEYEKCVDPNVRKASVYSVINYIGVLKELHGYNDEDKKVLEEKIKELEGDLADRDEDIENYIQQLDDHDSIQKDRDEAHAEEINLHTRVIQKQNDTISKNKKIITNLTSDLKNISKAYQKSQFWANIFQTTTILTMLASSSYVWWMS